MVNLKINGTKSTPLIEFLANEGKLEIAGESYPENALEFFKPIYDWLQNYLDEYSGKVCFNFRMTYFNTSSSKALLDMLDLLDEYYKKGREVEVLWYYETDDEDIQDSGEEFAEGLSMPYKLISY